MKAFQIMDMIGRHLEVWRDDLRTVAQKSGVPYSTLSKIYRGHIRNTSVRTAQKLLDFFCGGN